MKKIVLGIIIFGALLVLVHYIPVYIAQHTDAPSEHTAAVPWSLSPQTELPSAVEQTRQAIAHAAHEKKYLLLASLVGTPFTYSYGANNNFAEFLETTDPTYGHSVRIPAILSGSYGYSDGIYYWPEAYRKDPKDWTEKDMAALKQFNTDDQIAQYQARGEYAGFRIGIKSDGSWIFYVAGD
jgi:hypothetical protein